MDTFERRVWWAVRPLWMWRLLRLVLRSFWIAVAVGVAGWFLSGAAGWQVRPIVWAAGAYALFMILVPTMVLWPISRQRLARRLDHAFGLRDRLSTAGEVARRQPKNYLESQLLHSAAGLLADVRRRLEKRPLIPWADIELSLLALVVLFAIWVGAASPPSPPTVPDAGTLPLPPLSAEPQLSLPGLAPDQGGQPPFSPPEGQEGESELGAAEAQEVYDALTEALGENALTQRAGADLAQGNADGAADALRDLAAAADDIGQEARQQLAESLNEAADQVEQAAPDAAEQLRSAAQGLSDTGPDAAESAAAALEDLARLVETLDDARGTSAGQESGDGQEEGGEGGGTGDGSGTGGGTAGREEQPAGTVERLQSEGEDFELPEGETQDENSVLQPPERPGDATETRDTPYTQGGGAGSGGHQPASRLSLPWRLRNVIQRYFSPP